MTKTARTPENFPRGRDFETLGDGFICFSHKKISSRKRFNFRLSSHFFKKIKIYRRPNNRATFSLQIPKKFRNFFRKIIPAPWP
jgi:hypothetical protein